MQKVRNDLTRLRSAEDGDYVSQSLADFIPCTSAYEKLTQVLTEPVARKKQGDEKVVSLLRDLGHTIDWFCRGHSGSKADHRRRALRTVSEFLQYGSSEERAGPADITADKPTTVSPGAEHLPEAHGPTAVSPEAEPSSDARGLMTIPPEAEPLSKAHGKRSAESGALQSFKIMALDWRAMYRNLRMEAYRARDADVRKKYQRSYFEITEDDRRSVDAELRRSDSGYERTRAQCSYHRRKAVMWAREHQCTLMLPELDTPVEVFYLQAHLGRDDPRHKWFQGAKRDPKTVSLGKTICGLSDPDKGLIEIASTARGVAAPALDAGAGPFQAHLMRMHSSCLQTVIGEHPAHYLEQARVVNFLHLIAGTPWLHQEMMQGVRRHVIYTDIDGWDCIDWPNLLREWASYRRLELSDLALTAAELPRHLRACARAIVLTDRPYGMVPGERPLYHLGVEVVPIEDHQDSYFYLNDGRGRGLRRRSHLAHNGAGACSGSSLQDMLQQAGINRVYLCGVGQARVLDQTLKRSTALGKTSTMRQEQPVCQDQGDANGSKATKVPRLNLVSTPAADSDRITSDATGGSVGDEATSTPPPNPHIPEDMVLPSTDGASGEQVDADGGIELNGVDLRDIPKGKVILFDTRTFGERLSWELNEIFGPVVELCESLPELNKTGDSTVKNAKDARDNRCGTIGRPGAPLHVNPAALLLAVLKGDRGNVIAAMWAAIESDQRDRRQGPHSRVSVVRVIVHPDYTRRHPQLLRRNVKLDLFLAIVDASRCEACPRVAITIADADCISSKRGGMWRRIFTETMRQRAQASFETEGLDEPRRGEHGQVLVLPCLWSQPLGAQVTDTNEPAMLGATLGGVQQIDVEDFEHMDLDNPLRDLQEAHMSMTSEQSALSTGTSVASGWAMRDHSGSITFHSAAYEVPGDGMTKEDVIAQVESSIGGQLPSRVAEFLPETQTFDEGTALAKILSTTAKEPSGRLASVMLGALHSPDTREQSDGRQRVDVAMIAFNQANDEVAHSTELPMQDSGTALNCMRADDTLLRAEWADTYMLLFQSFVESMTSRQERPAEFEEEKPVTVEWIVQLAGSSLGQDALWAELCAQGWRATRPLSYRCSPSGELWVCDVRAHFRRYGFVMVEHDVGVEFANLIESLSPGVHDDVGQARQTLEQSGYERLTLMNSQNKELRRYIKYANETEQMAMSTEHNRIAKAMGLAHRSTRGTILAKHSQSSNGKPHRDDELSLITTLCGSYTLIIQISMSEWVKVTIPPPAGKRCTTLLLERSTVHMGRAGYDEVWQDGVHIGLSAHSRMVLGRRDPGHNVTAIMPGLKTKQAQQKIEETASPWSYRALTLPLTSAPDLQFDDETEWSFGAREFGVNAGNASPLQKGTTELSDNALESDLQQFLQDGGEVSIDDMEESLAGLSTPEPLRWQATTPLEDKMTLIGAMVFNQPSDVEELRRFMDSLEPEDILQQMGFPKEHPHYTFLVAQSRASSKFKCNLWTLDRRTGLVEPGLLLKYQVIGGRLADLEPPQLLVVETAVLPHQCVDSALEISRLAWMDPGGLTVDLNCMTASHRRLTCVQTAGGMSLVGPEGVPLRPFKVVQNRWRITKVTTDDDLTPLGVRELLENYEMGLVIATRLRDIGSSHSTMVSRLYLPSSKGDTPVDGDYPVVIVWKPPGMNHVMPILVSPRVPLQPMTLTACATFLIGHGVQCCWVADNRNSPTAQRCQERYGMDQNRQYPTRARCRAAAPFEGSVPQTNTPLPPPSNVERQVPGLSYPAGEPRPMASGSPARSVALSTVRRSPEPVQYQFGAGGIDARTTIDTQSVSQSHPRSIYEAVQSRESFGGGRTVCSAFGVHGGMPTGRTNAAGCSQGGAACSTPSAGIAGRPFMTASPPSAARGSATMAGSADGSAAAVTPELDVIDEAEVVGGSVASLVLLCVAMPLMTFKAYGVQVYLTQLAQDWVMGQARPTLLPGREADPNVPLTFRDALRSMVYIDRNPISDSDNELAEMALSSAMVSVPAYRNLLALPCCRSQQIMGSHEVGQEMRQLLGDDSVRKLVIIRVTVMPAEGALDTYLQAVNSLHHQQQGMNSARLFRDVLVAQNEQPETQQVINVIVRLLMAEPMPSEAAQFTRAAPSVVPPPVPTRTEVDTFKFKLKDSPERQVAMSLPQARGFMLSWLATVLSGFTSGVNCDCLDFMTKYQYPVHIFIVAVREKIMHGKLRDISIAACSRLDRDRVKLQVAELNEKHARLTEYSPNYIADDDTRRREMVYMLNDAVMIILAALRNSTERMVEVQTMRLLSNFQPSNPKANDQQKLGEVTSLIDGLRMVMGAPRFERLAPSCLQQFFYHLSTCISASGMRLLIELADKFVMQQQQLGRLTQEQLLEFRGVKMPGYVTQHLRYVETLDDLQVLIAVNLFLPYIGAVSQSAQFDASMELFKSGLNASEWEFVSATGTGDEPREATILLALTRSGQPEYSLTTREAHARPITDAPAVVKPRHRSGPDWGPA